MRILASGTWRRVAMLAPMIWLLAFGALLNGCDAPGATRRPAMSKRHIAVVGTWTEDPSWDVLRTVADRIAADTPGVRISFFAPEDQTPAGQQAVLDKIAGMKFDAVCILPGDALAIRDSVNNLVEGGKPVVLVGRDVPDSSRNFFVGPSEMEIGRAAAQACKQVLPGDRRTVMLLAAGPGDPVYGFRCATFKAELARITGDEVFMELDCGANPIKAQQILRRQSRRYPRVGGWVLLDDWPLRQQDDAGKFLPSGCSIIVCHDAPRYFQLLSSGKISAVVAYDLYEASNRAIRATLRIAEHGAEEPMDRDFVPVQVITQDDAAWHEQQWSLWRRGLASPPRASE